MSHARVLSAVLAIVVLPGAAISAADKPELLSVKKIWEAGNHNAFTDLIRFRDQFWCTFREADDHVGGDGQLRVLRSADGETWESAALLSEPGVDLRDPKLSVTPDGRLMITGGGSVYEGKTLKGRQPRVAFSEDGVAWTPTHRILTEGDWLWRTTWHKGTAYGVAYRTSPRDGGASDEWFATLYSSHDGRNWSVVCDFAIPNRANETTVRFLSDDTMVALVRRELGDTRGWIGHSRPPYTEWKWHVTGHRFGGPNFIVLPGDEMWAGSRDYDQPRSTILARMTLDSYEPVLKFPSGGDNSYPGFVWHDGLLWMSYYSSHEGKTSIYLARIRLPESESR